MLISVTHPGALRATTTTIPIWPIWCPYQSDSIKMKPQADDWISRPVHKGAAHSTEVQTREKVWLCVVKSDMQFRDCLHLWSVLMETPVECQLAQAAGGCSAAPSVFRLAVSQWWDHTLLQPSANDTFHEEESQKLVQVWRVEVHLFLGCYPITSCPIPLCHHWKTAILLPVWHSSSGSASATLPWLLQCANQPTG